MSRVSGITLIYSVGDDDEMPLQVANSWLDTQGVVARFTDLTDAYGGNKHPQITAIGSGLNYFDEDGFARVVGAMKWNCTENVVLVIQPEEGATRIWRYQPEWRELRKI